jgi:hypothetical protein
MPNDVICVIRSGLDYGRARQRLAQLTGAAAGAVDAREIAALSEAVSHWESVCGLPGSQAKGLPRLAKVA